MTAMREMHAHPLAALPLRHAPMAFIDLEMTGLDRQGDSIVEVCVERVQGEAITQRVCTLVRPEPLPDDHGEAVHGITAAALKEAPRFVDLAKQLETVLEGALMVAHAARHDLAFLRRAFEAAGRVWQAPLYLDTLSLARRTLDVPAFGLAHLAKHFSVDNQGAHRAANDVRVLRAVYGHLVAACESSGARLETVGQLLNRSRGVVDVAAVMRTAQQALDNGQVGQLRYRRRGKPVQDLSFCTTGLRADLDPPRVVGYLLPSRGRRELRADRILSFELLDS